MSKTVNPTVGSAVTTVFVCAGQQVIAEYIGGAADTAPERKYIFCATGYIDEPIALIDASGTGEDTYYYHRNRQFSIVGLTDSTGTVIERYAYTAYGQTTALDANAAADADGISDVLNPYTYTGRRLDDETGLHYFRARYHDSVLGRFLERDPLGYPDGLNSYAAYHVLYGGVDPSGLECSYQFGAGDPSVGSSAEKWFYHEDHWGKYESISITGTVKAFTGVEASAWVEAKGGVKIFGSGAEVGTKVTGKTGLDLAVGQTATWSWDILQAGVKVRKYKVQTYELLLDICCDSKEELMKELQSAFDPKARKNSRYGKTVSGQIAQYSPDQVIYEDTLESQKYYSYKENQPDYFDGSLRVQESNFAKGHARFIIMYDKVDANNAIDRRRLRDNKFAVVESGGSVDEKVHDGYFNSGAAAEFEVAGEAVGKAEAWLGIQ